MKRAGHQPPNSGTGRLDLIWAAALSVGIVLFFFLLQFQHEGLIEYDGYFHIKLSSVMRQEGIFVAKPWLRYTIFSDHYLDHHFLFHLLQMPFTFGDLIIGGKVSIVFYASLMGLVFYFLLKGLRIPYATGWTIVFLLSSQPFLYRMNMGRVQSVSLTFLLLGSYLLLRRKWRLFAVLAGVYVWLYLSASVFLPILLGLYIVSEMLVLGVSPLKYRAPLLWCAGIYVLALLINPHFPNNIYFIYRDILDKIGPDFTVSVGNEWYPFTTWQLFKNSFPVFAALGLGLGLGLFREKKPSVRTVYFLMVSLLYGLLLMKSKRFSEYWPAFTLLFAASSWDDWMQDGSSWRPQWGRWQRVAVAGALGVFLATVGTYNVSQVMADIAGNKPSEQFRDAALWLKEKMHPGEILFNLDWDNFPRLFFYNSDNYVVVGLDPAYMYMYDPELYALWRSISRGEVDNPSGPIRSRFNARYVFSDDGHTAFQRKAERDRNILLVYQDRWAKIYEITSGKPGSSSPTRQE